MKATRYFLFIFWQIAGLSAFSQKQNIRFEHLGTEKGLSQSNVICILQDSRGFMWFGTRDGLNKYDGYEFTVYKNDVKNKNSLSNNYTPDLFESKDGNIWIATWGGGLNLYNREKGQFTSYKHDAQNKNSLSSDFINSVLEDSEGMIWIGTEDGGLNRLDRKENKFTHFINEHNNDKSLGDVFVRDIFEDSHHNLWIGTASGGLNLFDRKTQTFKRFQHNEKDSRSISNNSVYKIFEDSRHQLWIGTEGGGLNLFIPETGEFRHFKHDELNKNSLSSDVIYSINEDNTGNLWIGTENGGLNVYNTRSGLFQTFDYDEFDNTSLNNNSVWSICRDTRGNIWLGTFSGGINLVNQDISKFIHYKHNPSRNSISHNKVLCIYEDAGSNIWIGTDGGGVNLFDPLKKTFTSYRHQPGNKNSIAGDYVLNVREDYKGNVWIGTWGDGITVFNRTKNTYTHFKNDPDNAASLSCNNAWFIFEDHDKNMWIGTYGGGLNLYNPANNSFTRYQYNENDPPGINNNKIHSIFEDEKGNLIVSTDGGGLNLFDKQKKTFTHLIHDDNKNSISNNSAGEIYEDHNGILWISTLVGLNSLDRKTNTFTAYTINDGLPNNTIFGIVGDEKGNLWISTNKGISRFNPVTKTFKNFGVADGLQSNEFKDMAYCKSRSGAIYFGGNNGFNQFYPDSIKEKSFDPPLVITGFQVFNKEVPVSTDSAMTPLKKNITETKEITIPHKSSVISFEFASLDYTIAERKQYAYMLEGFDDTWNEVGTQRTATYTNLDPGEYTFKVKGLNNDGSWSTHFTSLRLTITPPFWMTWWFKTIIILFAIGCLFIFYRLRIKTITKQKAALEKQVKERTNEIVLQKEELTRNVQELDVLKESLEKEKYFLDSLMDNMPDSIYFKDTESKLIRVSKFMADRFDSNVNDLIGKSDFDFQDGKHAEKTYEDEQDIQKTGKPKIEYLEKEVKQDGSEHWISTTKMPLINARGEIVGTFGMSRDVTQVKKLEQERHDAILDNAVAQGKFEIASDVMHDIGNAVVGFGSYLTRIRRLQSEDSPDNLRNLADFFEKQKTGLVASIGQAKADAVVKMLNSMAQTQRKSQEEINKSITEQLNIVTNIQEILNIQRQYITGRESQERKPVNMRNIINDSLSMLFASLDKMAIGVSLNIATELPIIKGDRTKLMQALLNILRNSIEAIDANAIEKNISVNAFTNAGQLVLQVKDNGKGFDRPTAEQLFGKGFTTKSSNSGMGLYNCKAILESHEGTIAITSDGHGKGAVATIGFRI
jgi:PAS domain S-box-containing protein